MEFSDWFKLQWNYYTQGRLRNESVRESNTKSFIAVERLRDSITNLYGKKIWEFNFRLHLMGAHRTQYWNCLVLIFKLIVMQRLDAIEIGYWLLKKEAWIFKVIADLRVTLLWGSNQF